MKTRALICFFLFLSVVVWAQPGDPGGDPDQVPISGIEFLLAVGAAFGIKRFINKRNKN